MSVFNYFIKDSNWKKKLAIGTGLDFILMINCLIIFTVIQNEALIIQPIYRNISILAILMVLITFIFYLGYISINTNLRISKPEYILANFENPKHMLTIGLKSFIVIFIMPSVYGLLLFPFCCIALYIQKILQVSHLVLLLSTALLFPFIMI